MASAIPQNLPSLSTSLSSEENLAYADQLDIKLMQVFQDVSENRDIVFSDESIFHARCFVRLSLNDMLNSNIEGFNNRESLTKTLVTVAVQAAKKDLFQEECPSAVCVYKRVNPTSSFPLLFLVETDSIKLSLHCALNLTPGQEGAYQLVGENIGILPTVSILEQWLEFQRSLANTPNK